MLCGLTPFASRNGIIQPMVRVPEQRYLAQTRGHAEPAACICQDIDRVALAPKTEVNPRSRYVAEEMATGEVGARLEQDAHQERECGKQSTLPEESKREERKRAVAAGTV